MTEAPRYIYAFALAAGKPTHDGYETVTIGVAHRTYSWDMIYGNPDMDSDDVLEQLGLDIAVRTFPPSKGYRKHSATWVLIGPDRNVMFNLLDDIETIGLPDRGVQWGLN